MLAVIQFPLADVRPFVAGDPLRLDKPGFPTPRTWGSDPEFVRCFGPAVDRRLDADPAWVDEQYFCRADRALRFVDFGRQRLGAVPIEVPPACVFRRLFSDGEAVARVEVGITELRNTGWTVVTDGAQCLAIGDGFMRLPTKVRAFRAQGATGQVRVGYQPTDLLVRQGHRLARLYAEATAVAAATDALQSQAQLVEDGRPLVIAEFDGEELQALPEQARTVDPARVGGAGLAFAWLRTPGGTIGTWFIRRDQADPDSLRRLRLCLLRLHAEREVLDSVIRQLHRVRLTYAPRTDAGDRLEGYLNRATSLVQRDERYGMSQSAILEAWDAADAVNRPDDVVGLGERLAGARTQVLRKAEAYEQARGASRLVTTVVVNKVAGNQVNVAVDRSQVGAIGTGAAGRVSGWRGLDRGEAAGGGGAAVAGRGPGNGSDEEQTGAASGEPLATVAPAGPRRENGMDAQDQQGQQNRQGQEKEPQSAGQTSVGSISGSQVGAIGTGAQGEVSGTLVVNPGAAGSINVADLKAALTELYGSLGQANLPIDKQIAAQGATGAALNEGIQDGKVEPNAVATHVKQVGDTLKEANVAVQEGSSLWESVKKLAPLIGPIVGGAKIVAGWFGVPLLF